MEDDSDFLSLSQSRNITECFVDTFPPEHCQHSSYNDFIEKKIPFIIKNTVLNIDNHVMLFKDLSFVPPQYKELNDAKRYICPREAAKRHIPYTSSLYVDIEHTNPLGITAFYKRCHIAEIPVMVKSRLCNLYGIRDPKEITRLGEDVECPGSYFLLGGAPVVISNQMRSATNIPVLFTNRKLNPKYSIYIEMRTIEISGVHTSNITIGYMNSTRLFGAILPSRDTSTPILYIIGILYFTSRDTSKSFYDFLHEYQERFTPAERDYTVHSFENIIGIYNEVIASLPINTSKDYKTINTLCINRIIQELYINRQTTRDDVLKTLHRDILLHIGSENTREIADKKIDMITKLLKRITRYMMYRQGRYDDMNVDDSMKNIVKERNVNVLVLDDDRDSMVNQRVATVGVLLGQVFNTAFKKLCQDILKDVDNINIKSRICPKVISTALRDALIQNRWTKNVHPGISQKFEAFNFISKLAEIRKITTSISADGAKIDAPRNLHGSHFGRICPLETPEGKKCGLVKNMALGCVITIGTDPKPIRDIVKIIVSGIDIADKKEKSKDKKEKVPICINGDEIVYTCNPIKFIKSFKDIRRSGGMSYDISISYDELDREIRIWTDYGRLITPVLICKDGLPVLTAKLFIELQKDYSCSSLWNRLVTRGYIEFIDSSEEENCTIFSNTLSEFITLYRTDPRSTSIYTHVNFDPLLIFGVGVSLVPFSDHNQAPRNTYQAGMAKQAIGIPGTNYLYTLKGTTHVLNYPQIPLLYTRVYTLLGCDRQPAGINTYTAICPWKGFNQEDSIVMNKNAVDRGYMVNSTYMEFSISLANNTDRFECPDASINYRGDVSKLDKKTATVNIGVQVVKGDLLIGMVQYIKMDSSTTVKRNASVIYDQPLPGIVHSITRDFNFEGFEFITVIILQTREPMVGDKFAAVHAQKGTISLLAPECDLPFDEDGVSPTICINPLALPSRMTIGMLAEMLTGTKICESSKLHKIDANCIRLEPIYENSDAENDRESLSRDDTLDRDIMDKHTMNTDAIDDYMTKRPLKISDDVINSSHIDIFEKEFGNISIDVDAHGYSKSKQSRDASPFNPEFSIAAICKELKMLGVDQFGDKIMYHPHTGRAFKCMIFTGMTYYQKLKHMVVDKMHARARGRNTTLCNQPIEGGGEGGGFKCGYMEKDSILASGASGFIHDRMFEQSDMNETPYCKRCGLQSSMEMCSYCSGETVQTKIPFATKLLAQEFYSMGIGLKVIPK